ncbi:hypothetical protein [Krasilnikoviella flava]|uniref:Integral membrane protein n=1 Tax=Krasilnikoviella flava TaxID=526729 RepID=A0A1T5KZD8_9MICO|nr:hypothetical protein [Krasilnikoviella flava]SKC69084.1 hypothetical protein SAMN04324258_2700 [Krasilnikoviella flava]
MSPAAPGTAPAPGRPARRTGSGFGRLLVTVYGILAFAAIGRSSYELATKFSEAPVAYSLSTLSAVVYVVATVALAKGGPRWRVVAWVTVGFEAVGVLAVGAASVVSPDVFGETTVWSGFGQGYGYVPLVLPFVGLWWLWRTRPRGAGSDDDATPTAPTAPEPTEPVAPDPEVR